MPHASSSTDASVDSEAENAGAPDCDTLVEGACWYLGVFALSCRQGCDLHGGFDARMVRLVGNANQGRERGGASASARVACGCLP